MPTAQAALERLATLVQPDGGWGYQLGQPGHLEPTCFALLALATDREKYGRLIDAGLAFVESNRHPDGTYRLTRGRPQAVWPTALVLFTKHALGVPPDQLKATADRLLAIESRVFKVDGEVSDMKLDIDVSITGWSWAEANFAWVEPTAWACLALRAVGQGDHPRVKEGVRLLLDRAFDTGGANYGNRVVLGNPTEPIPGPSALMLVALQSMPDNARVDAGVGYLRMHAAKSTDLEHLAWAKLALALHAGDSATRAFLPDLDERIGGALSEEMNRTDGLGAGPGRLALAALALREGRAFALDPAAQNPVAQASAVRPTALDQRSFGAKLKSKVRGWFLNQSGKFRPLPNSPGVHIARADNYDAPLADIIAKQFEHFRQFVPMAGKRVVLKPNLVEYRRERVINTDHRVIDAVIQLCKKEGASEIIVAEGPGHWRNVQFLVKESGLGAVLEKHGVKFVDLNHDEPVKTLNLGRLTGLDYLYLTKTVTTADVFVSLPKMKTHHWAGVTLSLKNLFGVVPGICYGWPKNELHWRGIPNSVVDIAATHMPHLAVVDAITGMEGDGPLMGTSKHVGALVMGVDLVAVDATCCRLMKVPPERIPTVLFAALKRLGRLKEADIPQLGEAIESLAVPFELPPNVEKLLIPVEKAAAVKV